MRRPHHIVRRYGSQAAELLLQPKDPSGDVVGGVVGLAAAAIAEGEEADPDEEFAVDLTRPHSRAVLEAKLLDARIDGRMTPQEVRGTRSLLASPTPTSVTIVLKLSC